MAENIENNGCSQRDNMNVAELAVAFDAQLNYIDAPLSKGVML